MNKAITEKRKSSMNVRSMTMTALLAAVAYVLAFIEIPVPLSPSFANKYHKTKGMAWISCIAGSLAMGIVAAITNYFILLPMFEMFMPLDQLIASFGAFIPFIKTKLDVVLFNAFPFNLLKGLVLSAVTMLIYKKLTLF